METLTKEQKAFLEECNLEFSDRFTDADLDYKKVFDEGIPPPPIMFPWHGRNKPALANRNRAGGSRYNDYRGERNNDRNRFFRNREDRDNRAHRDRHGNRYDDRNSRDSRYRPY